MNTSTHLANAASSHAPVRMSGKQFSLMLLKTIAVTILVCALAMLVLGVSASDVRAATAGSVEEVHVQPFAPTGPIVMFAQVAPVAPVAPAEASPTETPPALPPTGNGLLDQVLGAATAKYGWVVSIITWLWVVGMIFKPLFDFAHKVVDATPTDRDNVILAKIEASKVYTSICYVLDWVLRVKVGTQKPIPPVPGK